MRSSILVVTGVSGSCGHPLHEEVRNRVSRPCFFSVRLGPQGIAPSVRNNTARTAPTVVLVLVQVLMNIWVMVRASTTDY